MNPRSTPSWQTLPALLPFVLGCAIFAGCDSRPAKASSNGRLRLEVVSREGGEARPGILARALLAGREISRATTDAAGRADLDVGDDEPLRIVLEDPAGAYFRRELDRVATAEARVGLDRSLTARLTARAADGGAVPSTAVTLWSAGRAPLHFQVGADGTFGPVPAGPAKLLIVAPGHACAIIEAVLKPGRQSSVAALPAVRLLRGGARVRGRVLLEGGAAGARVIARFHGVALEAPLEADGAFLVEGLPQGDARQVMLVLERAGIELLAREVDVSGELVDLGTIAVGRG